MNMLRTRWMVALLMLVGLVVFEPTLGDHSKLRADSVDKTLSLGSSFEPMGLALAPNGQYALLTNFGGSKTHKVDLSTFQLSADSWTTGGQPRDVALSADGRTAVVVNGLMLFGSERLFTIDMTTGTVNGIVGFQGPLNTNNRVVIDSASRYAYISGLTGYRLDLTTEGVTEFSPLSNTTGLAISQDGRFLYAAKNSGISKIDLGTGQEVAVFALANAQEVAVAPSGSYIVAAANGTVVKMNADTGETLGTAVLDRASSAKWIAVNPAGSFAYVATTEPILSKINLVSMSQTSLSVERAASRVVISSDGSTAYVTGSGGYFSRVALAAADPQTVTFTQPTPTLLGTKTMTLWATATSTLPVSFATSTPTVCTVSGNTVSLKTLGDCTITASQAGGSGWAAAADVVRTFKVLPDPPAGEPGISLNDGAAATNSKKVTLSLVWPAYASEARISNDGGFAASKTQVVPLSDRIAWEIDDSVKGLYTKVVYVRFNGVGIDTTKTYQDDIILDTTAPTIQSSTATVASDAVQLSVKAIDDITGVDSIEVQGATKVIEIDYSTSISIPLGDLGVSAAAVRTLASKQIRFRIADGASNWTAWTSVDLVGLSTSPSSRSVATSVGLSVSKARLTSLVSPKNSKATTIFHVKVITGSSACRVVRGVVMGKSPGQCKLRVTYRIGRQTASSATITVTVRK